MTSVRRRLGSVRRSTRAATARVVRRARLGRRVDTLPAVFGNSMAKAGSHLLAQFLEGLTEITPLLFLDPFPLRTITAEGRRLDRAEVLEVLTGLKAGEIRWGYLPSRPEYVQALLDGNRLVYFLMRDPRDKVVSHILYATGIHKGHAMRGYYAGLPDMEARIDHTIRGVPGLVQDIRAVYESYLGWLDQPQVLTISFEDLIQNRAATLTRMLDHLEKSAVALEADRGQALARLDRAMTPKRSPTFRAGQPGNWRQYFTEANRRTFQDVAGDLLVRLGYEQGVDW